MLTSPCSLPGHESIKIGCQKCFYDLEAERDRYKTALKEIRVRTDSGNIQMIIDGVLPNDSREERR